MRKFLSLIFVSIIIVSFSIDISASNDFNDVLLLDDNNFMLESSNKENFVPFFEDVSSDAWYFDAVAYLYDRGSIHGTSLTNFSPDKEITRAEFIKILGATAGVNNTLDYTLSCFNDVSEDSWYAPYIQWGVNNNITVGKNESEFLPDMFLTREEAATMIYRLGNSIENEEWNSITPNYIINDKTKISSWAFEAVNTLIENNIIRGYVDGNFEPDKFITRAEAAQLLSNYLLSDGEIIEVKFNEWDYIIELQGKTDAELLLMGFSENDIIKIKNFTVEKELQKLKNTPNNILSNMGYNDSQIAQLKSTPSLPSNENGGIRLSSSATDTFGVANLRLYITIEKLQSTVPNSYAVIYTEWEWESFPGIWKKDAVFIGWNQNMKFMDNHPTKSRRTIYHKNTKSGEISTWTSGFFRNYENYYMNKSVQIGLFNMSEYLGSYKTLVIDAKDQAKWKTVEIDYYDIAYKGCARVALEKTNIASSIKSIKGTISYAHYLIMQNNLSYTFNNSSMIFSINPNPSYQWSISTSQYN